MEHALAPPSNLQGRTRKVRLPSLGRLEEVNKELWLLLSMFGICLLLNYVLASQRMVLSLYTFPTIVSAYVYGRRHATLTAFASVLIVVLLQLQNPVFRIDGALTAGAIDRWLDVRARNAERLIEHLSKYPALRVPVPPAGFRHAWYKLYGFVRPEALKSGWDRDRVLRELAEQGGAAFSGSCPEIYLERAFDGSDSRPAQRFETARRLGETSLMLLVDPCQTAESLDAAAAALGAVLRRAAL